MSHTDSAAVRDLVARAGRRATLWFVIAGIACGLTLALLFIAGSALVRHLILQPAIDVAAAAAIGLVAGWLLAYEQRHNVARRIERRAPESRNLILTAAELLDRPHRDDYVGTLVVGEAAKLARTLDVGALIPIRWPLTALIAAAALAAFTLSRPVTTAVDARTARTSATLPPAVLAVDVVVTLPAYVHSNGPSLHDPSRIEAFAGSRIRLTVHARGAAVTIETLHGRQLLKESETGTFGGEFTADADGYIAIEPATADGHPGARRLIGLSVAPDLSPRVHITTPGHDLKFPEGRHTIDLAIEADDDIGLASLKVRYTKVSGSGERFTFTEGEVPLAITRTDHKAWKAHASWHLDSLALGPGDMVVYRAVATDDRPGAAPSESDSYIAEILAPGGVAAAGFAMDPEVERYALSEQMVILKTQKLIARKPSMVADSLSDAAAEIANEQRRVRAEFVFMMGGEIGGADDAVGDLNEEAEAGEGDFAQARLLNQGRAALIGAIRAMSRADKALTASDLTLALTQEQTALTQLEKTFAHSRIILRALTEREKLDPTRRLSGTLTDASRDVRAANAPASDPRAVALRQALGDIATVANGAPLGADAATKVAALAERVLRVDPSSIPLQGVAQQLTDAATAINRGRAGDVNALLDKAATDLAATLRAGLLDAPREGRAFDASRLAGALTDALRRPHTP